MRKFPLLPAFLLLFLTACAAAGGGPVPTPTMVPTPIVAQKPTYTVARGDVVKVLELRGRVVPVKQQDLFFGAPGYVQEVLFARGDFLHAGDVIARLEEPPDYAVNLAVAEAALAQAQADLETRQLDLPLEIAQAQVDLLQRQSELAAAQTAVANLGQPRVNDPLRLEQAEAALTSASNALDKAQAAFDKVAGLPLNNPNRVAALNALLDARRAYQAAAANLNYLQGAPDAVESAQAQANLALAQARYDRAAAELARLQQEGGPMEIRLAEARVHQAQADLEAVQRHKEEVELRAPFDGQLLSLGIAVGSQVSPHQAVGTLADLSALEIAVLPTPQELADLGVGQAVVIRLTSQPEVEIPGHVRLVPDLSDGKSDDLSVRIVPDDPAAVLNINEAVSVIVQVEARRGVLYLPPAALRSFQGRDFVLVLENGVQRRLDVLLGLRAADRVEIVSGLEEGQVIVGP